MLSTIRYVYGKDAKLSCHDDLFLDVELSNGEKFYDLEPRSLFIISDFYRYISFQNKDGEEEFILIEMDKMEKEQKEILRGCLDAYYRMPKITKILSRNDTSAMWVWTVETDKGVHTIEMVDFVVDIKKIGDKRVIFKDKKSNRYEIPDMYKLDKKDFKSLFNEL